MKPGISIRSTLSKFTRYDHAVLLICLFSRTWVPFNGQLYVCEIFAMFYFLRESPRILSVPSVSRKIFFFGMIWCLSQVLIDVLKNTDQTYSLKNFSNIFFATILTCVLIDAIALMSKPRKKWLGLWVGVGIIVGSLIEPNIYFSDNPIKWGLGMGFGLILISLISLLPKFAIMSRIFLLCFCISLLLYFDSRSLAGFFLLSVFYGFRKKEYSHSNFKRIFFLIIPSALFVIYGLSLFASIAPNSQVATKINADKGSSISFLNSRTELFFEVAAIQKSPFFGFGSDPASPPQDLIGAVIQNLNQKGVRPVSKSLYGDTLPVHSEIFGSMVRGGLFPLFFWFTILILFWRSSFRFNQAESGARILAWFCFFYEIWAIFFSPLASTSRFDLAFTSAIVASFLHPRLDREIESEIWEKSHAK